MRVISERSIGPVGVALFALTSIGSSIAAEPPGLEGAWSGSGKVRFTSGNTESARCQATFKQRSTSSFGMIARCATSSGRVEQTAVLRRVASNQFAGDFKNTDYGVSGSISITINGSSLDASLSGDNGGGAEFKLSR